MITPMPDWKLQQNRNLASIRRIDDHTEGILLISYMTDEEKVELLSGLSRAVQYAKEHCADELALLDAKRTVKPALEASESTTAGKCLSDVF